MDRTAAFLFALSILVSTSSYSQYFHSINYREGSGLPSSESYKVFQDRKGFVWIATDNGVVRYDGKEFITYNVTNGLTDNTVFGFHEDHKGRIWFRTFNGYLSYYENDSIKTYKYNSTLKSMVGSLILDRIVYDSLGQLFFSSAVNAPAGKIDSAGVVTILSETDPGWGFMGFIADKMIFGDSKSMPRNLNFIKIDGKEFSIKLDDWENRTTWIIASTVWKGKIYFTIHKNIFVYDGQTVKKIFVADHPFITLYVDHSDRLWAGEFNNGVTVFRDESLKDQFSLVTISEQSVSSILQDYEDGVWISTLDQGVFYFPNLTVLNYNAPNDMRVSAVAHAGKDVYLGNYGGDVFRMGVDGKAKKIDVGVAPISCLFVDKDRKLWITDPTGTRIHENGVYVGGTGNTSISFKSLAHVDNYVIGCTSMGLVKVSLDGRVLKKTAKRRRPSSIAIVNNEVYVGGVNGVEKFDSAFNEIGRVTTYRTASLISIEDRFILVGTVGNGLFIYDVRNSTFTALPVADVLSIYSIVSDWPQRRIWLGTDKGLFQINFRPDPSDLKLSHFSKADGLVSSKINNICRIEDNIWAVSDLGISSVPLDHFTSRDYQPRFYINRLLFQNRSLAANTSFVRTDEESMVIEVRAIRFKGHPTLFRYRLDPTSAWQMVSNGSIFLTNLRPDKYRLEIQASSGYDNWTESLMFRIEVLARWWETWTFRITFISTVLLLGYLGYWLRINAIRRQQKYLELINLHQQKLIDSEIRTQERERKRIATDLHDGIGASLSSIKIQIADAMTEDEKLAVRAHEINENLNDVIDDIKRIVYDLHPPGLERYGLQAGIKTLVDRLNKTGDINVIFDYYGNREIGQLVSITIFRIVQELINNTLKHARASEIRIHINEFDDEINIMYEDNGIGMVGSKFTGLGMHSIESRVRSLNGRMTWESNHKGTFYNFDIPF